MVIRIWINLVALVAFLHQERFTTIQYKHKRLPHRKEGSIPHCTLIERTAMIKGLKQDTSISVED